MSLNNGSESRRLRREIRRKSPFAGKDCCETEWFVESALREIQLCHSLPLPAFQSPSVTPKNPLERFVPSDDPQMHECLRSCIFHARFPRGHRDHCLPELDRIFHSAPVHPLCAVFECLLLLPPRARVSFDFEGRRILARVVESRPRQRNRPFCAAHSLRSSSFDLQRMG